LCCSALIQQCSSALADFFKRRFKVTKFLRA
jgi:hypothetical protein